MFIHYSARFNKLLDLRGKRTDSEKESELVQNKRQ